MEKLKIGNKYQIHSYKHNGQIYKAWDEAVLLKYDFKKLYIMVDTEKVSTCCFLCRQVITELFDKDIEIVCMSQTEEKVFTVKDLCPYPFDEDDLK